MKSAYDRFWDVFDKRQKINTRDEPFEIGTVISENPLIIEIDGLSLIKDNLYINPDLLERDEKVNAVITTSDNHRYEINSIHCYSKLLKGTQAICYGMEYDEVGKTYQKYAVLVVIE